jgi:hypothetical protein
MIYFLGLFLFLFFLSTHSEVLNLYVWDCGLDGSILFEPVQPDGGGWLPKRSHPELLLIFNLIKYKILIFFI